MRARARGSFGCLRRGVIFKKKRCRFWATGATPADSAKRRTWCWHHACPAARRQLHGSPSETACDAQSTAHAHCCRTVTSSHRVQHGAARTRRVASTLAARTPRHTHAPRVARRQAPHAARATPLWPSRRSCEPNASGGGGGGRAGEWWRHRGTAHRARDTRKRVCARFLGRHRRTESAHEGRGRGAVEPVWARCGHSGTGVPHTRGVRADDSARR